MGDILTNCDENEDILTHHGILGQRWGVRRYQNSDGSYTRAGELRRKKSFKLETKDEREVRLAKKSEQKAISKAKKAERKAVNQAKKVEKAAKREEKQAQKSVEEAIKLERKKYQILRSGDADRIYKNQHLFSDQEMNSALNRLRQNEQVRVMGKDYQKQQASAQKKAREESNKQKSQNQQQNRQQTKNGKDMLNDLWKAGKMAVGMYATYNQLAKAVNTVSGDSTLPEFKDGNSFKKWSDGRKEAKEKASKWDSNKINMVFDTATGSNGVNWYNSMTYTPINDVMSDYGNDTYTIVDYK